jgi:alkanesulfonate monooxygenase SsuD/methylene tetrahydromethanopterin reductase-like flavin-dependent oxidoreductase (luciferase family)
MDLSIGISEDLPVAVQQMLAGHVESAGFRSLWTNEASGRDALLLCHAWAAATTDLEVGVGVVPLWTRSPAQLAMASATLQEASGGRFLLGIGVSHEATMGPWHGAEVTRPRTAARELLTILEQLETGRNSDVAGEVLRSERFRLRISPTPPPTRRYLAAMGPRMLDLGGSTAAGVLLNWSGPSEVGRAAGYRPNTEFGGHGVGRTMHGDPHVPNDGEPGRGLPLRPGLVIAIEPWFMAGTDQIYTDPDGWTLRSVDGSRGAHAEHTVAITEDGPIVLTAR